MLPVYFSLCWLEVVDPEEKESHYNWDSQETTGSPIKTSMITRNIWNLKEYIFAQILTME